MSLKDIPLRFKESGPDYSVEFDITKLVAELDTRSGVVAETFKQAAYDSSPVDTGRMRNSIHVEEQSDGNKSVVVDTEYASYTEYKPNTSCTGWFSGALGRCKSALSRIWLA